MKVNPLTNSPICSKLRGQICKVDIPIESLWPVGCCNGWVFPKFFTIWKMPAMLDGNSIELGRSKGKGSIPQLNKNYKKWRKNKKWSGVVGRKKAVSLWQQHRYIAKCIFSTINRAFTSSICCHGEDCPKHNMALKQGNRHPRARQGGGVPAGVNHRAADQILP